MFCSICGTFFEVVSSYLLTSHLSQQPALNPLPCALPQPATPVPGRCPARAACEPRGPPGSAGCGSAGPPGPPIPRRARPLATRRAAAGAGRTAGALPPPAPRLRCPWPRTRARPARRRGVAAAWSPPAAKMAERQLHNAAAQPPTAPPRRAGGAGGCGSVTSHRAAGDSPRHGRAGPRDSDPRQQGAATAAPGRRTFSASQPVPRPRPSPRGPRHPPSEARAQRVRCGGQDGASSARPPGAAARGGGSGDCCSPAAPHPRPRRYLHRGGRLRAARSPASDRAAAGRALRVDSGAAAEAGAGLRTADAPRSPLCLPLAPTAI